MYLLVKHGHHNLVSLVNLQITAEDADLILNALGRSGSRPSLLHVTVEVFGTLECRGINFEEERERKYPANLSEFAFFLCVASLDF